MSYVRYPNVTREILDTVCVGDLIKINEWKVPLRVKAVSENYFVMTRKQFGHTVYSVCSKLPWDGIRHNEMRGGMFHCSTDNWVFGSPLSVDYEHLYDFENDDANDAYLQSFESGETALSERKGVPIYELYIKKAV